MNPNAPRSRGRNAEADAYWRRRFFTLLAGLGLLGLLAWALSGTMGVTPRQSPAAAGASAAAYGSAVPGQAAGTAGTPTYAPSSRASISMSASPTPSPKPSATPSAKATRKSAARGPHPTRAVAGKHACPARDTVLTLLTGKTSYGPGERPKFQIDIVSTDAAECTVNTGPASLRILITSGSRSTWDSGACLRGATAHMESLRRGIPSVASITWNRHLRTGGCAQAPVTAGRGRYTVMAVMGSVSSQQKTFRLR